MVDSELLKRGFGLAPITGFLGMRLDRADNGEASVTLPFREELRQGLGIIHGGVLSLLADSACWFAAASSCQGSLVTTVDLGIHYLKPAATTADLVATAEVVHNGRRVITARFEVLGEAGARLAVGLSTLIPYEGQHEGIPQAALEAGPNQLEAENEENTP